MPLWPIFRPWPCLDSQLPSNTELSLLCHNDESGQTLRLRTTSFFGGVYSGDVHMGLSENVGYIPNEIAIFHRDNDQQNHWV